jgi:hypothetical protein
LGLQLVVVNARTDSDLETAFAAFSERRVGAVLVESSAFYNRRMEQLAAIGRDRDQSHGWKSNRLADAGAL